MVASFSLLTFNAFGTARSASSFLRWRGIEDPERLEHPSLLELIESTTIACFQEIFLSEAEEFFARLSHPERHADSNATELRPLTFGGSGLAIASRFPRIAGTIARYAPPHTHAERFARKGILHARLAIDDSPGAPLVDVVTTHLQAGNGKAAIRVRERQLRELGLFVAAIRSPDRAAIVCGDFNVDALAHDAFEYRALCDALPGFVDLGAEENAPTFDPRSDRNALAHRFDADHPVQRIDCVFFRAPDDGSIVADHCELVLDRPLDERRSPPLFASDHFGLRATFRVAGRG